MQIAIKPEVNNIISHLLLVDDDNRFKSIELLNLFLENYPEAPGSIHNHQAYAGGYFVHVSDILTYAIRLYTTLSKDNKLKFKLSDAILVLFLHDIEKPVKYCDNTEESDSEIRTRLIKQFGFKLNSEHYNALKYIHGEGEDYRKDKRVMSPLCAFCHCCDIISARIFFD
jgi:hypothetical protein